MVKFKKGDIVKHLNGTIEGIVDQVSTHGSTLTLEGGGEVYLTKYFYHLHEVRMLNQSHRYSNFISAGWTDKMLVENGYAEWITSDYQIDWVDESQITIPDKHLLKFIANRLCEVHGEKPTDKHIIHLQNIIREMPEPEINIDWASVPRDTLVEVSQCKEFSKSKVRYFSHYTPSLTSKFQVFPMNRKSSESSELASYPFCRLIYKDYL